MITQELSQYYHNPFGKRPMITKTKSLSLTNDNLIHAMKYQSKPPSSVFFLRKIHLRENTNKMSIFYYGSR